MAKIKLERVTFYGENKDLAEKILEWMEQQDSAVTVRRVFYAMVARQYIENKHSEYRRVSQVVLKLRRGGLLDWNAIEDTTRGRYKSRNFSSAEECVTDSLRRFRLDRWEGQKNYVEVWVEKRGHVSVLYPATNPLDVSVSDCGGRMALNADSVEGLIMAADEGKKTYILYVGDYDPSGLSIDENMKDQLMQWGVFPEWRRVALTYNQIDEHNLIKAYTVLDTISEKLRKKRPDIEIISYTESGDPLVNKLDKDSSAKWFKNNHNGDLFQVEVDAVEASVLRKLVERELFELLDFGLFSLRVEEEEEERKEALKKMSA